MTHPDLRTLLKALEKRIVEINGFEVSTSVLTGIGLLHLTTEGMGDELCTIADAQHWQTPHKLRQIDLESLRIMHAIRRAAEYHANHRGIILRKLVVRHDLTEGVKLTHTTTNQLRRL